MDMKMGMQWLFNCCSANHISVLDYLHKIYQMKIKKYLSSSCYLGSQCVFRISFLLYGVFVCAMYAWCWVMGDGPLFSIFYLDLNKVVLLVFSCCASSFPYFYHFMCPLILLLLQTMSGCVVGATSNERQRQYQ